ncbi:MAG: hypothetical protein OHK0046_37130 [Anaerolineae bacterium]
MTPLTENLLAYGSNEPLPEQLSFSAGPLRVTYEAGTLRNLRLGDVLILQSVYAAVRDQNWGTVPGVLTNLRIDDHGDSFSIRFTMKHQAREIDFTWDGTITGTQEGVVRFQFAGKANSTFKRNRIGFCVQHPMQVAGQSCTVEHVDGIVTVGVFPERISPHQPFFNLNAITHEVVPGITACVRMEGDTFEMEDQRNWTDASFKTYCTPLSLPFPVVVEAGTEIHQTITVTLNGTPSSDNPQADPVIRIRLKDTTLPLPPIGLVMQSPPLDETTLTRLHILQPSHLRVDLQLDQEGWRQWLAQAAVKAEAINTRLELAVCVSDDAEAELRTLNTQLPSMVARIMLFHQKEKSTRAAWVRLARRILTTEAPIGAGTDAFFAELNRERPPLNDIDFACYSINPQVHAFDNDSLVETLAAQAVTVASARAFTGDKPIVVSPVTFKMRWNPNAFGPPAATPPGELPAYVDTRQMSLFGAGWTVGSIKALAESGATSLTYFETTGWGGVMDSGNTLPEKFPSIRGGVYPMYHVFTDIQAFAGGEVIVSESSAPLAVSVLALQKGDQRRLLLANHTRNSHTVILEGQYAARVLDTTTAEYAMRDPAGFRSTQKIINGTLTLSPYAVACLNPMEARA